MRFTYCPDCGSKLIFREIGDEGAVPYCEKCSKPRFDMFSTCVIVLVTDGSGNVALLRQKYISTEFRNLISGYMKPGESAEEAAMREVKEEIGVTLDRLRLVGTVWFGLHDMLMIAFMGHTDDKNFKLSGEVDSAEWVPASEAIHMVHPKAPGNASYMLVETYLNEQQQSSQICGR